MSTMHQGLDEMTAMIPAVDLSKREQLALVIIDMQYHDASPDHGMTRAWEQAYPGSMSYYNDRLTATTVPAIRNLLNYFRNEKLTVIHLVIGSPYRDLRDCPPRFRAWTRNMERAAGIEDVWWAENPDFAVIEPLAPLPDETVVRKTTNGAFNGSEFDATLQRMGITSLVITGCVTSACVETTARDAADRGYDCVLVSDACADYDPDMHDATMKAFALYFGRVAATGNEVIDAVTAGSSI
ncbi:cysteine hydrolase family protein [Amorphus orientalis]|uniref:Nicotinamidase-related amidase n=1 Tax=Amorphus orientalis TaxID=649198 RepID=A0AAE3VSK9_9HYPH|nr:cysteine hydrolase [Amorphus orientalis]MDQ0317437.1 nicotinamidase-related amidase [Amorphus orientalis]